MGLLLWLLWLLLDLVVEIVSEGILELTRVLNEAESPKPVAIVWFIIVGSALGAASALLAGWRILDPGPFLGVSLLAVPAFLGGVMEVCGRLRSRQHAISHLATWYGGASMGLGLASGRLGALFLLKAV